MRLLLITGFLGAGKTTLIKRLLSLHQNERLALIVNEFGRVGVDGALLSGLGAALWEVSGGSVFCSCRLDQFENALCSVIETNPDLILVEASGLSDPTAIRTVLSGFPQVTYAGCLALCDAAKVEKVLHTVRACARQLSVADLILLNKTDMVSSAETERLRAMLAERCPYARIEPTEQAAFKPEWLEGLGQNAPEAPDEDASPDITLQKALIQVKPAMTERELRGFLRLFLEDTFRVKGFVRLREGGYLANCVGAMLALTPCAIEGEEGLVALAGRGMPLRQALKAARAQYVELVETIIFG